MKKYLRLLALPIILFIVILIILITNIPRLEYTYSSSLEGYVVSKAVGNANNYEIKETYKNEKVVGIAENAFNEHSNLRSITLPDTVIFIGRMAFNGCTKLESINLDNVEEIERNAFAYCESLETLTIGAKDIGASAFYKCLSLSDVELNNTITIGDMAFARTNIKTINIPSFCLSVGDDCFSECYLLETINVYGSNLKNNSYLNSLSIVNYIDKE